VLLNLGHGSGIVLLGFNGSTLLSVDANGHWVLWNYATGAEISAGDSACLYGGCSVPGAVGALSGSTAVIRTKTGFLLLSASTGASAATITTAASWWGFAPDGSYLVAGSSAALTIWSPTGQVLVSRPGNYSGGAPVASPGAVRIAAGRAGANVIETVAVPSGADTVSAPFNGSFSSWFVDGSSFLSTAGNTVLMYSDAAVQEAALMTPGTVNGLGPWFWTFSGSTLNVYALASPMTPAVSYTSVNSAPVVSGSTLLVPDASGIGVIDLSGAVPTKIDYTPTVNWYDITLDARASASNWVIGGPQGQLADGPSLASTPRYFGYGQALSIAANSSQIAVSTASGTILYFNAVTLAQEGVINFTSDALALSPDGSLLAAAPSTLSGPSPAAQALNVYSLPAGALLYSWPYPASSGIAVARIAFAGTGPATVLAQTLWGDNACTLLISAPTGGTPSFCGTTDAWLQLSPDGTVFATSTTVNPAVTGPPFATFGTNLYQNNKLVTAISGWPVGWIDDTHLLVNSYQPDFIVDVQTDYVGCAIYGPTGANAGTCQLPGVAALQSVNPDSVYANNLNEILTVSSGSVSWASGNTLANPIYAYSDYTYLDALAGHRVVFVSSAYVLAQSY